MWQAWEKTSLQVDGPEVDWIYRPSQGEGLLDRSSEGQWFGQEESLESQQSESAGWMRRPGGVEVFLFDVVLGLANC